MKRILFISILFGIILNNYSQVVINLSPDSTLYDLHILGGGASPSVYDTTVWYVRGDATGGGTGHFNHVDSALTIAEHNAGTFYPGDSIYIPDGQTLRGSLVLPSSGSYGSEIVYSRTSGGAKPKIYGSDTTDWVNVSANIWSNTDSLVSPQSFAFPSNIWFEGTDGSITWGFYDTTLANLDTEYEWCMKNAGADSTIYVFAATDPDVRYSQVEVGQRFTGVDVNSKSYIKWDGLHIAYWVEGISGTATNNYTVDNSRFNHFGTRDGAAGFGIDIEGDTITVEDSHFTNAGRRPLSFYNYGNDTNHVLIVQRNLFDSSGYHTSAIDMSTGGGGGGSDAGGWDSVVFRNNKIKIPENFETWNDNLSAGILLSSDEGTGDIWNAWIYGNLFYYVQGAGIQVEDAKNTRIYNNTFYGMNKFNDSYNMYHVAYSGNPTNAKLKNNSFYIDRDDPAAQIAANIFISGITSNEVDVDYNHHQIENTTSQIVYNLDEFPDSSYNINELSDLQTEYGWELNGYAATDPLIFSDSLNTRTLSPLNDSGLVVADLLGTITDVYGNTRNDSTIGAVNQIFDGDTINSFTATSTKKDTITISTSGYPGGFERVVVVAKEGAEPSDSTDGTVLVTTSDSTAVDGDYEVSGTADSTWYVNAYITTHRVLSYIPNKDTCFVDTSGVVFHAYYQQILDTLTANGVTPPAAVQTAQNNLVTEIDTLGNAEWGGRSLLDSLDGWYVCAASDSVAGLFEWSSLAFARKLAFTGTVTFDSLEGFTSDGSTGYSDLGWDASNDGVNFTQNSGFVEVYTQNIPSGDYLYIGNFDNGGTFYGPRFGGADAIYRLNQSANTSGTVQTVAGFGGVTRDASNNIDFYYNGSKITDDATASASPSTLDWYLWAINLAGSETYVTPVEISIVMWGAGLSETMMGNLNSIVEKYMDAIGKGVQ